MPGQSSLNSSCIKVINRQNDNDDTIYKKKKTWFSTLAAVNVSAQDISSPGLASLIYILTVMTYALILTPHIPPPIYITAVETWPWFHWAANGCTGPIML